MMTACVDLLVVGGGINGVGIARDAIGRGFSVLLVERGDLAGATSSASSKLIHGGLRYLEHHEFRLVREALAEREVMLRIAPHIVRPMRFVLPHRPEMRPRWMMRLGLFLYDHLASRVSLPGTESISTRHHRFGLPLKPEITSAFAYSDCWVDDARLVLLNVRDAAARGAEIALHTEFLHAERGSQAWTCRLSDRTVCARAVVNAAGPWVQHVLDATRALSPGKVRLIRGSHIVLPALYAGAHAYILQHDDGRVVFVMPYEDSFSLVGTTEVTHQGDPADAQCTPEETAYLCAAVSGQFRVGPRPQDVVWSYAGVRPLYDDGSDNASEVTRDYVLKLDTSGAPLLSVFGGKLTTYRRLAEESIRKVASAVAMRGGVAVPDRGSGWTAAEALPGGRLQGSLEAFTSEQARVYPFLHPLQLRRLTRTYGSELQSVLGDARNLADLGEDLGAGLTERELHWLMTEEWACSAEDVLWRRTKLGLHMSPAQRQALTVRLGR